MSDGEGINMGNTIKATKKLYTPPNIIVGKLSQLDAAMLYNIYCDESCHLEHDNINVMAIGAIWCPQDKLSRINTKIKQIKEKHGIAIASEIKWTKISPSKIQLYKDIVDYFFDNKDIHFRCLVVPDKKLLDHQRFKQTHDDWYYKMYFTLLKTIFSPESQYEVYIDIKDTHTNQKAQKLHEVCCNEKYDFSRKIIRRIQPIRSHEVQIMQITDILTGGIAYQNRHFEENFVHSLAKIQLIEQIIQRSRYKLTKSTLLRENKLNIFIWDAEANFNDNL